MSQGEGLSPIQPFETDLREAPEDELLEDLPFDGEEVSLDDLMSGNLQAEVFGGRVTEPMSMFLRGETAMTEAAWELHVGSDGQEHWSLITSRPRLNLSMLNSMPYIGSQVDPGEKELIDGLFDTLAKYPLLNPDLEQIIFQLLSEGGSVEDLRRDERFFDLFPEADREAARVLLDDSKTLRDLVYLSNMRLLIHTINRYRGLLPFSDLVMAGTEGMMKAIDKFEYKRGLKFSTYATWWVKGSTLNTMKEEANEIRIPPYVHDGIGKLREFVTGYNKEYGEDPTIEEVEQAMIQRGIPELRVKIIMDVVTSGIAGRSATLDTGLYGAVPDTFEGRSIDAIILREDIREVVIQEINRLLSDREAVIVIERWGLGGDKEKTLEQVAPMVGGITRERVRQIEKAALKKLVRSPRLRSYMEIE